MNTPQLFPNPAPTQGPHFTDVYALPQDSKQQALSWRIHLADCFFYLACLLFLPLLYVLADFYFQPGLIALFALIMLLLYVAGALHYRLFPGALLAAYLATVSCLIFLLPLAVIALPLGGIGLALIPVGLGAFILSQARPGASPLPVTSGLIALFFLFLGKNPDWSQAPSLILFLLLAPFCFPASKRLAILALGGVVVLSILSQPSATAGIHIQIFHFLESMIGLFSASFLLFFPTKPSPKVNLAQHLMLWILLLFQLAGYLLMILLANIFSPPLVAGTFCLMILAGLNRAYVLMAAHALLFCLGFIPLIWLPGYWYLASTLIILPTLLWIVFKNEKEPSPSQAQAPSAAAPSLQQQRRSQ